MAHFSLVSTTSVESGDPLKTANQRIMWLIMKLGELVKTTC